MFKLDTNDNEAPCLFPTDLSGSDLRMSYVEVGIELPDNLSERKVMSLSVLTSRQIGTKLFHKNFQVGNDFKL